MQTSYDLYEAFISVWFISNLSLAVVWWCKGVVAVGQTSMLQGAVQPPLLPLIFRLYSSSCSICVQILSALCVHCTQAVQCVLEGEVLCVSVNVCKCMCLCVWMCVTVYHNLPLLLVVTIHVCVLVFLPLCGITADYDIIEHLGSASFTAQQHIWEKLPPASGPCFHNLISSNFNLSDPLVGSTSTLSWLTEHVFLLLFIHERWYYFELKYDTVPGSFFTVSGRIHSLLYLLSFEH